MHDFQDRIDIFLKKTKNSVFGFKKANTEYSKLPIPAKAIKAIGFSHLCNICTQTTGAFWGQIQWSGMLNKNQIFQSTFMSVASELCTLETPPARHFKAEILTILLVCVKFLQLLQFLRYDFKLTLIVWWLDTTLGAHHYGAVSHLCDGFTLMN